MLFLTSRMIKEAEQRALEDVSSLHLIENAARALYNELKEFKSVRIYCGKGNNGSDGYATAILLKKNGIRTEIVQVQAPQSEECIFLARKAAEEGIDFLSFNLVSEAPECILDAIFGIGISGEITDQTIKNVIDAINVSDAYVVSADIPSGMNADTGEECSVCVRADKTVTFTAPKCGMLSGSSVDLCGEIVIKEVGIPVNYTGITDSTCVPITDRLQVGLLCPVPVLWRQWLRYVAVAVL